MSQLRVANLMDKCPHGFLVFDFAVRNMARASMPRKPGRLPEFNIREISPDGGKKLIELL